MFHLIVKFYPDGSRPINQFIYVREDETQGRLRHWKTTR